jgi:aspartokinase
MGLITNFIFKIDIQKSFAYARLLIICVIIKKKNPPTKKIVVISISFTNSLYELCMSSNTRKRAARRNNTAPTVNKQTLKI